MLLVSKFTKTLAIQLFRADIDEQLIVEQLRIGHRSHKELHPV